MKQQFKNYYIKYHSFITLCWLMLYLSHFFSRIAIVFLFIVGVILEMWLIHEKNSWLHNCLYAVALVIIAGLMWWTY